MYPGIDRRIVVRGLKLHLDHRIECPRPKLHCASSVRATITNLECLKGETGATGAKGEDGVSPRAYITQNKDDFTLSVIDSKGETNATWSAVSPIDDDFINAM